jgi:type I restriction enzyme S subunit
MKSNYRPIGDFIELVDARNKDLRVDHLLGLSITKEFIPSVANTVGTNMSNYKIIKKNQFACSIMQVRRDKKMPVALLKDFDEAIISQAYPVFQVINEEVLSPDYLMMWFSRAEFDRYACFLAVGGVRGSLEWDDFLEMELPVPSIEKQLEIVKEYNTIVNRIKINEQLNQKLEETAQAIYKHWFVDFEFPNENSRPYITSGGKMAYNDELDKEVPEGWEIKDCGDLTTIKAGGDKPKIYSSKQTKLCSVPIYSNSMKDQGLFGFTNNAKILEKSITISARGGIGFTSLRVEPYVPIVRLIVVIPKELKYLNYLFHFLTKYEYDDIASAQAQLTIPDVSKFKVAIPPSNLFQDFQSLSEKIYNTISIKRKKNKSLLKLGSVLLSKMSKVESLKAEQVL